MRRGALYNREKYAEHAAALLWHIRMQRSIRDVWVSGWVHRTTIEWTRRIWCTHISFLPHNWINVCSLVNPLNSWEFVWVGSLTEANEFNSSLMCCISVHSLVAHLSLWFFSGYFRLLGTVIERHTTPLVWFILEFRLHLPLLSSSSACLTIFPLQR